MNDYNSDEKLYPKLPKQNIQSGDGSSFRLKKSSDILTRFENEEKHYAGVRKKYKRFQSVFQNIYFTSGSLSILISACGLGTSLSGFGIVIGIPLGLIGGFCGILSIISGLYSKKIGLKVSKHEKTLMAAKIKITGIKGLVSKSLIDGKITDYEFESILSEVDKFEELKQQIRNKNGDEKKNISATPSESYINLLRKDIQESFIKNLQRLQPSAPPE